MVAKKPNEQYGTGDANKAKPAPRQKKTPASTPKGKGSGVWEKVYGNDYIGSMKIKGRI
jgi:hypothetical protein